MAASRVGPRHVDRERRCSTSSGCPLLLALAGEVHTLVERLAGDPAAAAAVARPAYEIVRRGPGPTLAAILARALFEAGRDDEALAVAYAMAPATGRRRRI